MLWIQKPNFCSILSKPASSVSIIQLIPYPEGGKGGYFRCLHSLFQGGVRVVSFSQLTKSAKREMQKQLGWGT